MGQKINPIGLRLGINRGWDSTWFAKKKDFGKFLIEDFKIRKYIKKNITNSGVSEIIIETICPIGKKIKDLLKDQTYLKAVIQKGKEKANLKAEENLKKIRDIVGLI